MSTPLFGVKLTAGLLLMAALWQSASGATYYVSTTGSNTNNGSSGSPWRNVNFADGQLASGDTLVIRDGTYAPDHLLLNQGNVTVRAENDGKVTIDANYNNIVCNVPSNGNTIEGIIFREGQPSDPVVRIDGNNNVFRRCSAYDAYFVNEGTTSNPGYNPCFGVTGRFNLFEECIAAGSSSHAFRDWNGTGREQFNTFRRCFATSSKRPGNPRAGFTDFNIYGGSRDIIENCIGWGGGIAASLSVHNNKTNTTQKAQNNQVLGSVFKYTDYSYIHPTATNSKITFRTGYNHYVRFNEYVNCVFYGGWIGSQLVDHVGVNNGDDTFRNCTIRNAILGSRGNGAGVYLYEADPSPTYINTIVYNNHRGFIKASGATVSIRYTNSYGNGGNNWPSGFGAGSNGNVSVDPQPFGLTIPAASAMSGAGLNGEDMGANVYYRYVDGVLTQDVLWPWPTQARILAELGIDVMGDLENLFGTIVAPGGSTSNPAPEIAVFDGANEIPSGGGVVDFGAVLTGGTPPTRQIKVTNTGSQDLTTSGLTVPTPFTVTEALAATIAAGASDTFTIELPTSSAGTFSGTVSFNNNDTDENPFTFLVEGQVANIVQTTLSTEAGTGADSTIRSGIHADTNYGSSGFMGTSANTGDRGWKAYVRFDLASVEGAITDATARFYAGGSSNPATINVYLLNDGNAGEAWDASTITWNNAPANDTASPNGLTAAATLLGTISRSAEAQHARISFTDPDLLPALQNTTDSLVTLILTSQEAAYNGWDTEETEPVDGTPGEVAPELLLTVETVVSEPEVNVLDWNLGDISDGGGPLDFGSALQGAAALSRTFTVENLGTGPLATSGLTVPAAYTVTEGLAASIASGASDTFTVELATTTSGTFSGAITFDNDDGNENPYNFSVTGTIDGSLTTMIGNGADTLVRGGTNASTNYGGSNFMSTKADAVLSDASKTYFRFDISSLTGPWGTAAITLNNSFDNADTLSLYGLVDGASGDDAPGGTGWNESAITWNNAPANDTASPGGVTSNAMLLATFQQTDAPNPPTTVLTSGDHPNIVSFLNDDTNGLATFILTSGGSVYNSFRSKEYTPTGGAQGDAAAQLELTPATSTTISSADGSGADTYIRGGSHADTNFNADASQQWIVKSDSANLLHSRKAYIRFDTSSVVAAAASAKLTLQVRVGNAVTLSFYGLNDGDAGEGWGESTVTWNNAPANATGSSNGLTASRTTFLGSYEVTDTGTTDFPNSWPLEISTAALADFIDSDTDGQVTIIVTGSDSTGGDGGLWVSGYVKEFTGSELGSEAPRLEVAY